MIPDLTSLYVPLKNNLLKKQKILSLDYQGIGLSFELLGMILISEAGGGRVERRGPQATVWRGVIHTESRKDNGRAAWLEWEFMIWNNAEKLIGALGQNSKGPEHRAEGVRIDPTETLGRLWGENPHENIIQKPKIQEWHAGGKGLRWQGHK